MATKPMAQKRFGIGLRLSKPPTPFRLRRIVKIHGKVDWYRYKERHLVECFFNKIKHFRRVATRYDKLAESFLSFVYIAAIFKLTQ